MRAGSRPCWHCCTACRRPRGPPFSAAMPAASISRIGDATEMLKGIDPVLTPDLLWVLAAMGHGDDLALVDANHPAQTIASATTSGRLIRLPGLTMERAARAV